MKNSIQNIFIVILKSIYRAFIEMFAIIDDMFGRDDAIVNSDVMEILDNDPELMSKIINNEKRSSSSKNLRVTIENNNITFI